MRIRPLLIRRTTAQAVYMGAAILGIWSVKVQEPHLIPYAVVIGLVVIGCILRKGTLLILIMSICFLAGTYRGYEFQKQISGYDALYSKLVTVKVLVVNDAVYGNSSQLTFVGRDVREGAGTHLPGTVLIAGFGLNSVYAGDEIQVTGKMYPAYGQYQGRISYAKLDLVDHHTNMVYEIRRRFSNGLQNALPEPQASFALGLLLGQRSTLPDAVKQSLLMVGLTHIIAVSGYNLTILLNASKGLLRSHSRRLSISLSAALIFGFVMMTGGSASIVRATIISLLSIVASLYGRKIPPSNLLLIAAAITAWANPVYVWSDASWYLSFLAFFGVLIVSPVVKTRFFGPGRRSVVFMIALETFCAELMTIPYVLHEFGQMSLIGLVANVLVAAFIPLAMLLGFIAALAGVLAWAFTSWLCWPAVVVLSYMLDIAKILSRLPHVFIEDMYIDTALMIFAYASVFIFVGAASYKNRSKHGKITDKEANIIRGRLHNVRTFKMVDY